MEQLKPSQDEIIASLHENPTFVPYDLAKVLGGWLGAQGISDPRTVEDPNILRKALARFWRDVEKKAEISLHGKAKGATYREYLELLD